MMGDEIGRNPGEHRATAKQVEVEFPVSVVIDWPIDIPYSDESAIDVAQSVVSQSCEIDVGDGKIVWAKCYAEVNETDARVVVGGEDELVR